jgi:hypothetical protein
MRKLVTWVMLVALTATAAVLPLSGQGTGTRQDAVEDAKKVADRRYRVGIGASFDFLNGLSATDLYGDVTIRIPEVFRLGGTPIGFDGGLYNGRATTLRETRELNRTFRFRGIPHQDSMTVVTQGIARTEDKHTDNLTLFFGPTLRFHRNVSIAGHAEVHRQELVTNVTIRTISLDTVVEQANGSSNPGPDAVPRDTSRTFRTAQYGAFFGVGPLVNFNDADYNFWHKPIIGVEVSEGRLYGAYAVQFRLTDYDHGFKLGGEVRGRLTFEQPSIAVFLARDFSLRRLADFLVGGDDDDDDADDADNDDDDADGDESSDDDEDEDPADDDGRRTKDQRARH